MKFQSKVFNTIIKSKLIDSFLEKTVDRDTMQEYYDFLEDKSVFSRYIFNVLDICCDEIKTLNMSFNDAKNELGPFFREVIVATKEIAEIDIEVEAYVDIWLYSIIGEPANYGMTLTERLTVLSSLSMPKIEDKVEPCFKILYLGEYIEALLREQPVNLTVVRELTDSLATQTTAYNNATKKNKLI